MDNATCNLIYVHRSVREDRVVCAPSPGSNGSSDNSSGASASEASGCETPTLRDNVSLLLEFIGDVRLCSTGASCMSQLFDLHDPSMVEMKPTVVLIDVPNDERIPDEGVRSRSPSPYSCPSEEGDLQVFPDEDVYGTRLLQKIVSEAHLRNLSNLVVPIPLISFPEDYSAPPSDLSNKGGDVQSSLGGTTARRTGTAADSPSTMTTPTTTNRFLADRKLLKRLLDLGATDVMIEPLNCVTSIQIHAYRAYKEAVKERQAVLEVRRGRKRSWVGVDEQKPFAYLREAMVSGLMNGICRPEDDSDDRVGSIRVSVGPERRSQIARLVSKWHFCAHDLSDDELIVAASCIFRHALAMPELQRWRISTEQLTTFLIACRGAYNSFVPYHNFRHVVDVLQATFNFLIRVGALPPFPSNGKEPAVSDTDKSPMALLLRPFDALTLLITAIGHDVGHPGVNNGFLITLNAPLAQLYNDRSVLESFHCAAYSQILRRRWPAAFEDSGMRNLMISSILATDMGLHFDYMKKLEALQERLLENNSTEGWNPKMIEEQKALVCALLIKCADISNVARKHDTALQWMHILSDEFARQASMETELEIPSALMAPPKKDVISMFKAQLGFMNLFAIPLFKGVADILPQMKYCVDELQVNKDLFDSQIAEQVAQREGSTANQVQQQQPQAPPPQQQLHLDDPVSPKTVINTTVLADGGRDDPSAGAATGRSSSQSPADCAAEAVGLAQTTSEEKETSPSCKPSHVPELSGEYKEVNGIVTTFDAVADFAASDPFNMNDGRPCGASRKQRCSEATDGSASAPGGGDWASQATSATTGKMPLSPSTQATSIISRESLDRSSSVPVTTVTAPDSFTTSTDTTYQSQSNRSDARLDVSPSVSMEEDASTTSSNGKISVDGTKTLKKKTSRFRMNALTFFRRHKSTSPPLPAADTAG